MSQLREALESALNEGASSDTPEKVTENVTVSEPVENTEKPVENTSRERDESGRFAKKEALEPQALETPPEPPKPERRAPSSWKPAAQEAFLKADRGEALTPEEIRLLTAEAERRENDFHNGVKEFKTYADRARSYEQVIAPYQAHLQKMGVDAPTAIGALMRADYTLRTSDPVTKANYFAQLAREYGIDLNGVQQPQQIDPQMQYLTQQLNELRQSQMLWQNQLQQQEQMRAQQELGQFATADKPHFEAVRNDMADLLETGKAKSLNEAYEMAVWMRQDTRQSLLEQQRIEAQKKAVEHAQAQKARSASVSVKGSSPSSSGVQPVKGSLRDMLASQLAD